MRAEHAHVFVTIGSLLWPLLTSHCLAATLNVPSEYPTIQAAVDASADGDSIVVAPGSYTEQGIHIKGKRLSIVGAGRDATFFSSAPAIGFLIVDGSEVNMNGFDITSGGGPGGASCFLVGNASLALAFCRIHHSNGGGSGGGAIESTIDANISCSDVIFLENSGIAGAVFISGSNTAFFTRCSFENNVTNRSFNSAGAVHVMAREARFVNCDFIGNTSVAHFGGLVGGLYFAGEIGGTCLVDHCFFLRNEGTNCGGILVEYGGSTTIRNCTIVANEGKVISAVGVGISGPPGATLVENSIITGNGPTPALDCFSGMLTVTCSDVWGNTDDTICPGGLNNITVDPQFCGLDRWDLQSDSPCAEANSPKCGNIGLHGVGCGVSSVKETTWGQIKAAWHIR